MKKLQKIGWILLGLSIITNIAFYPFLPSRIAIQFNSGGISNTASKPLALLLIPALILLFNILYGRDELKALRSVLLGGFLFVLNIIVNVVNLIIA